MRKALVAMLFVGVHQQICSSFAPSHLLPKSKLSVTNMPWKTAFAHSDLTRNKVALHSDKYGKDSPMERNLARTCVRQFLTQRSVQSLMFLLDQCRDPHTVHWMEEFSGFKNMLRYHGTGAFNSTRFESWDSFLLQIMEAPGDTVVVSAKRRGAGTGGWSKNNPYLQERFVEFEIDIDPPSLASRILSVREQIAKEWIDDLDIVIKAGDMTLDSYFENVIKERDDEEYAEGERPERPDEENISSADEERKSFDRAAMYMLNNNNAFSLSSSSPLRKGNFDLLLLLATQESIHRVLRKLQASGSGMETSYEWLRDFYIDRIKYFDGDQKYGRADDFLEDLMLTSPSVKQQQSKTEIINPLGLAENILNARGKVASEWKEIVKDVPRDHMDLRRKLLARQMGKVAESQGTQTETGAGELGAFE